MRPLPEIEQQKTGFGREDKHIRNHCGRGEVGAAGLIDKARFMMYNINKINLCRRCVRIRLFIVGPGHKTSRYHEGDFMKLILAIVNSDDSGEVMKALTRDGVQVTKLATNGGFLMAGNTTFMIGTDEEKVDGIIQTIQRCSHKRTQAMPASTAYAPGAMPSYPVELTVGGATVLVLNVERFEKL